MCLHAPSSQHCLPQSLSSAVKNLVLPAGKQAQCWGPVRSAAPKAGGESVFGHQGAVRGATPWRGRAGATVKPGRAFQGQLLCPSHSPPTSHSSAPPAGVLHRDVAPHHHRKSPTSSGRQAGTAHPTSFFHSAKPQKIFPQPPRQRKANQAASKQGAAPAGLGG